MATNNVETTLPLLADYLDELPGHVNSVLVQIGKLFRHQARPELRIIEKQKFQAHEALAKITRQFHESLDEVENEILSAKAVIERDLGKIRARQMERENAQRALAAKASADEEVTQSQDVPMQDYAPNKGSGSEEIMVEADTEQTPSGFDIHNAHNEQPDLQGSQDLKDISLDDDDLFGGETDTFGPDSNDPNFDFTVSGDFDMDFSTPAETTNAVVAGTQPVPELNASTDVVRPEGLADNELLLHDFGDANNNSEMHTNGFGDIDFGHVDNGPDGATDPSNPFGSINTDDDDFNSFFD